MPSAPRQPRCSLAGCRLPHGARLLTSRLLPGSPVSTPLWGLARSVDLTQQPLKVWGRGVTRGALLGARPSWVWGEGGTAA